MINSHFLTHSDQRLDSLEGVTKVEVDGIPMEVIGKKKDPSPSIPSSVIGEHNDKKVCLWPIGPAGTTCGKTFTKFDSLKRHLSEAHRGVRPYSCNLCDKSYGRRDYLQRHFKSHNANYAVNLSCPSSSNGTNTTSNSSATVTIMAPSFAPQSVAVSQQTHHPGTIINAAVVAPSSIVTANTLEKLQSQSQHHISDQPDSKQHVTLLQIQPSPQQLHSNTHQQTAISTLQHVGNTTTVPFFNVNPGSQLTTVMAATPLNVHSEHLSGAITNGTAMSHTKCAAPKLCDWILADGTACGKSFSKMDSLRRHISESHEGVRPYACTSCNKTYGRRDYLDRHLKSHGSVKRKLVLINNQHPMTVNNEGTSWTNNSDVLMNHTVDNEAMATVVPQHIRLLLATNSSGVGGSTKKKRKDIPVEEKKICLWILDDGTACGKAFTKFDSLKRHVSEAHKGVRPFSCTLCGKNYGRKDYLLRHLKSHNESESMAVMAAATSVNRVAPLSAANIVTQQQQHQLVAHVMSTSGATPVTVTYQQSSNTVPSGSSLVQASAIVGQQQQQQHTLISSHQIQLQQQQQQQALQHAQQQHTVTILQHPPQPTPLTSTVNRQTVAQLSLAAHSSGHQVHQPQLQQQQHLIQHDLHNNAIVPLNIKKRSAADDKKVCKWPLQNGTECGRSFSKFDSLRRHVSELHKGIRPYVCSICSKSYGRRDYLDRHAKSHNVNNCNNLILKQELSPPPTSIIPPISL